MGKHPTAVTPILNRAEQEVHVWANPAVEGVTVVAELRGLRVGEHVSVGEPGAPDGVAGRLGFVFVAEDGLAGFGADTVGCDDDVG